MLQFIPVSLLHNDNHPKQPGVVARRCMQPVSARRLDTARSQRTMARDQPCCPAEEDAPNADSDLKDSQTRDSDRLASASEGQKQHLRCFGLIQIPPPFLQARVPTLAGVCWLTYLARKRGASSVPVAVLTIDEAA